MPTAGKRYLLNNIYVDSVWVFSHKTHEGYYYLKQIEGDKVDLDQARLDHRRLGRSCFFVDGKGQWWAKCRDYSLEVDFILDEDEPFMTPQITRSLALDPY